jgi:formate dehydrogenase iron-sulfur subunit
MTTTVFVPGDSGALAVGAEETARAIADEAARRGESVRLVRNGSRGMFWLEPLVEVQTAEGRIAYGPVDADQVPELFDSGLLKGAAHALRLGLTEEIPWLARQERLTYARVGITDPLSLEDYAALDGFRGLTRALSMSAEAIVEQVTTSGLRGRGGAAFPTGIKWNTVRQADAERKYIACNADEGDSGTFSDRMIMEGDPYALIEGMTIAALAVGADYGYIYLRSEYPYAIRTMNEAIRRAREAGWLGNDIKGSGNDFDIEVRVGAAPTSAVKRPRCSIRWRASAA